MVIDTHVSRGVRYSVGFDSPPPTASNPAGYDKGDIEMSTYGILLPCDGTEPLPVSVGDHNHIGEMVGGLFDAVRFDYDAEAIEILDAPASAQEFVAVGYVNDTGLLDGMPVNIMASIVFGRELRGPVVVVSGTSPNGEYDGDNHDVPTWFSDAVFEGGLHGLAGMLDSQAHLEADAIKLAYADGVFTDDQYAQLLAMMESNDSKYDDHIAEAISIALVYVAGRSIGVIGKFDRQAYEAWEEETFSLSDEEIAKFWEGGV